MSAVENFLKRKFRKVKFDYSQSQMREITCKMKREIAVGLGKRAAKKGEKGLPMIATHIKRPKSIPLDSGNILAIEIGGKTIRWAVGRLSKGRVIFEYYGQKTFTGGVKTTASQIATWTKPLVEKFNLKVAAISIGFPLDVIKASGSGGLIDGRIKGPPHKGFSLGENDSPFGLQFKKAIDKDTLIVTVGNDTLFGTAGNWSSKDISKELVFDIKGTGANYFIEGFNTEAAMFSSFPYQPLDWIPKGQKKDPYLLEQYTAGRGFEQQIIKITREILFKYTPTRIANTLYELESEKLLNRDKVPITAEEIFKYLINQNEAIENLVESKKGFGGFLDREELRGLKLIACKIFERAVKVNGMMWEALFDTFELGTSKSDAVQIACDGSLITKHRSYRDETVRHIKEIASIFGRKRYVQYVLSEKNVNLKKVKGVDKEDISWGLIGAFVLGAISALPDGDRQKVLR